MTLPVKHPDMTDISDIRFAPETKVRAILNVKCVSTTTTSLIVSVRL